jgi:hypothetical protein
MNIKPSAAIRTAETQKVYAAMPDNPLVDYVKFLVDICFNKGLFLLDRFSVQSRI